MSNLCCTNTAFLGCYDNCNAIDTGLVATVTGDYIIREYWLNQINEQTVTINATENIIFPNIYNEQAEHVIKIIDPNGNVFVDSGNDCFSFKTSIKL